jgi:hypothetical protein
LKNKIKEIIDYFYSNEFIHGPVDRLTVGDRVSKANTIFNTRSGTITVGNGVIFGHNCMVLTGLHNVTTRGSLKRRLTTENANNIDFIYRGKKNLLDTFNSEYFIDDFIDIKTHV